MAWKRAPLCLAVLLLLPAAHSQHATPNPAIERAKQVERSAGIRQTGNFAHDDPRVPAFYRCYFTHPLELPDSYAGLKLRNGSKDGCQINPKKHDVFFYPIEAVASGRAPVTESLAAASTERIVTVVPHEDFHEQIRDLPDAIAEAAATLVGFITGAEAIQSEADSGLYREARLFLEKSVFINRHHDRLSLIYKAVRDGALAKDAALLQKQAIFVELQQGCNLIHPEPRSFNKCLPAANNAGLAFDHTYTKFYPLLYQVLAACRNELKCTIEAITHAPHKANEAAAVRYFQAFLGAQPFPPAP